MRGWGCQAMEIAKVADACEPVHFTQDEIISTSYTHTQPHREQRETRAC
jgi:hypothetical protein